MNAMIALPVSLPIVSPSVVQFLQRVATSNVLPIAIRDAQ